MKIHGIDGMSDGDVNAELENGGKFVTYSYCVSIVFFSFKRSSDIYFIRAGNKDMPNRLGYSLISLVFGPWGIPWGPIWTASTIGKNLAGGENVTRKLLSQIRERAKTRANLKAIDA